MKLNQYNNTTNINQNNIMVTHSANGLYRYNAKYYGKSLHIWCQEAHRSLAIAMGWHYRPLIKGAYGYDALIVSIGYMFDKLHNFENKNKIAKLIHKGWILNYNYWKKNKPWLDNSDYRKPSKPLGDTRRNKSAKSKYNDLPEDEQETNLIIATFIQELLN